LSKGEFWSLEIIPSGNNPTIALATLGCKLNQAESESIGRQLIEAGCKVVDADQEADIYLINTCSVTHIADRKSRHLLRAAHRLNPSAHVVAMGCYAESGTTAISEIDGVDLIVNNSDKNGLVSLLQRKGLLKPRDRRYPHEQRQRTRSLIKAQEGCNYSCTYCIVPRLRGPEISVPATEVISEINRRVADGYQEVVLTGTEVGHYSYQGLNLTCLVREILTSTVISRLRISSLQPQEVDGDLLQLWENPRLCRHFHLSLQSGSDSVLFRMRRRYSSEEYKSKVEQIRRAVPGAAITTDVIVGFPCETDSEFLESYKLCSQLNFAHIHVFPFSPRRGTAASEMDGQVCAKLKDGRSQRMLALSSRGQTAFINGLLGSTLPVLFEHARGGVWAGLTDNYVRVYATSSRNMINQVSNVTMKQLFKDGILGEVSTK
jgi:threonylcarbamoyladenosine tRNA methylthiotransferase MtaB